MASGSMEWGTAVEFRYGKKAVDIKVNGKIIRWMDTVNWCILTGTNMRESGKMINFMAMGNIPAKMDILMRDNGPTERNKAEEHKFGKMGRFMLGSLRMGLNMVEV